MKMQFVFIILLIFCTISCGTPKDSAPATQASCVASDQGIPSLGTLQFGSNFKTWLSNNNYTALANGRGWGGSSASCSASIANTPVIFVHGNGGSSDSFASARTHFLANGYNECELYAISYQLSSTDPGFGQNHYSASRLAWLRNFINAVQEYTGSSKVNIIGWSMGVNMTRKAVTGGTAYEDANRTQPCDLGDSIKDKVDTFIGLVGASYGLKQCVGVSSVACSENGFTLNNSFAKDLNGDVIGGSQVHTTPVEAQSTYSLYSTNDGYICDDDTDNTNDRYSYYYGTDIPECTINGMHLSRIPGETAAIDIDSILNYLTPPLDTSTKLNQLDHIMVAFDAKSLQLIWWILANKPNQTELDSYYGGL